MAPLYLMRTARPKTESECDNGDLLLKLYARASVERKSENADPVLTLSIGVDETDLSGS
jgi:hypothetical protein